MTDNAMYSDSQTVGDFYDDYQDAANAAWRNAIKAMYRSTLANRPSVAFEIENLIVEARENVVSLDIGVVVDSLDPLALATALETAAAAIRNTR
jgi:hypothetical protein